MKPLFQFAACVTIAHLAPVWSPLVHAQDECSTAMVASEGANPFSTTGATASADPVGESQCAGTNLDWGAGNKDVWFAWTAPANGRLTLDTCGTGGFDTSMLVYAGPCGALAQIACNGDSAAEAGCQTGASRIARISVASGVTYLVRIGGRAGAAGTGELQLDFEAVPDGALDARYPLLLAVQDTETQFGDSSSGLIDSANGSELDVAYATIRDGALHIFLGGNLESNFNKLDLFIDAVPGGQQQLRGNNADVDFNGLNRMGDDPATAEVEGLRFDDGFTADHYMSVTCGGQPFAWYMNYASLPTEGGGSGGYVGSGEAGAAGGRIFDSGFGFGLNNSNVEGVVGGFGVGSGLGVTTGLEFRIPLEALIGYTGGTLRICAFINGGGHDYASNQFLAGLGGRPNLAEPRLIDLSSIPGNQYFVFDPACEPDADGDGTPDCVDGCPNDPAKTAPGACGCGVADTDTDSDGTPDCYDGCPNDPAKTAPGACGCGVADTDSDNDGTPDCIDGCPNDPAKTAAGACGCGVADTDTDNDGTPDCNDGCPNDPAKTAAGACGCGVADTDTDNDGVPDCNDNCDTVANPNQLDCNANGIGDACEIASGALADCDADGIPNICEGAQLVALESGLLAPFGSGTPVGYEFTALEPVFVVAPRLTIEATSDLNSSSEFIAVTLDGGAPTYIFVADGSDCPATPDVWSRTFTAAEFSALVADGALRVDLVASGTVSTTQCTEGGVRIRLTYEALPTTSDCNDNGILDTCEVGTGAVTDCNDDDIPDTCQILAGTWADCDGDGVLDACELLAGTAEDCDRDGVLDACAIAAGEPDCNANGTPDRCEGGESAASLGSVGFAYNRFDAPLVKIAAGVAHYTGLDANGNVVSWGYDYGVTRVPQGLRNATRIAAGSFFSAAVDASGRVYCWGYDATPAMANLLAVPADLPPAIDVAVSRNAYSGWSAIWIPTAPPVPAHAMALLENGGIVCWGSNSHGQCSVPAGLSNAVGIAAGGQFSLALCSNGSIAAWGFSISGATNPPSNAGSVAAIAAGDRHALGLRTDGTVFGWGSGQFVPPNLSNVVKIAVGATHSVALKADGSIAAWGSGEGQLANNSAGPYVDIDAGDRFTVGVKPDGRTTTWGTDYLYTFREPVAPTSIRQLAVGSDTSTNNMAGSHFVALRDDGTVACWGSNRLGESDVPAGLADVVEVAASGGGSASSSYSGGHSMALTRSGQVICWGRNTNGQCNVPPGLKPVIAIATSATTNNYSVPPTHCLALQIDGRVAAWGSNTSGQCNVPVDLGGARAIAAGEGFSIAARTDGTVRAWGNLGAPSLTNVRRVAAGYRHGVALRGDGTVATWGASPPPVGLTDVRAIAAGYNVSYALRENGTIVRWGTSPEVPPAVSATTIARLTSCRSISASGIQFAVIRAADTDCDGNGVLDSCEIAAGTFADCNGNGLIDACEIVAGDVLDCNANAVPDTCDIVANPALDCDGNGRIDACDVTSNPARDCNGNGVLDSCELASGSAPDCDANGRVDTCDITTNPTRDCDANGLLDSCEIAAGAVVDCNGNGRIDACDTATGSLTAWGSNGSFVAAIPRETEPIIAMDAGFSILIMQRPDGTLFGRGVDSTGTLNIPTSLGPVSSFSTWNSHVAAVDLAGTLHCWGDNSSGQCNVPNDLGRAIKVSTGWDFTLALLADGTLRGWGNNNVGQLNVPTGLAGITSIACGSQHAVAVYGGGLVRAWGSNQYGQVGAACALTGATRVAAGEAHNVALRNDGSVVCWGAGFSNSYWPQFGQSLVPPTLGPCVDVDAGYFTSVALQSNGTVVRWGKPTTTALNPPQALSTVQLIAAANDAFVAYRTPTYDCNDNDVIDSCESGESGTSIVDCNANTIPDDCEISSGFVSDLDQNGIPDNCGDLVVGGSGYATISEAIAAAPDGAIITVRGGLHAPFAISGRSITLRAANGATPEISGSQTARCATIDGNSSHHVVIDGFQFLSGAADIGAGIFASGVKLDLLRCAFGGNVATVEGGAIATSGVELTCANCVFSSNSAAAGGMLAARDGGLVTYTNGLTTDGFTTIEATAFVLAVPTTILNSRFEFLGANPAGTIIAIKPGGSLAMGDTGFCRNESQNIEGIYDDLGGNWFSGDCNQDGTCDHEDIVFLEAGLVEWSTSAGGNGHRYFLLETPMTWNDANWLATRLGGHLATATSAAENAFIQSIAGTRSCWLGGLQDDYTEEPNVGWRWVTDETWDFTAWYPGEPNDANNGEDRLMTFAGQWTDIGYPGQGGQLFPAIIEFSTTAYLRVGDCNGNDIHDGCELDAGTASDCNANGEIDACEIAAGAADCDADGVLDACELASGAADCNANGVLDTCDIAQGGDCNANGIPDACDIAGGASDCDANGVPDACQLASGASTDLDDNGVIDECAGETVVGGSGYATIQAAVNALPPGSTVRVAPGTWGPVDLSGFNGALESLTGAEATIIDGGGAQRCITYFGTPAIAASVSGFTLRGGNSTDGGAARVDGARLDFLYCVFADNVASDRGGAICTTNTDFMILDCDFRNNSAARGGAVFIGASTTSARSVIDECVFEQNSATNIGGALRIEGNLDITRSIFTQNTAGIAGGGASFASDSDVAMSVSRFCVNAPDNIDGPFAEGGGNTFSVDCNDNDICDADEIAADPTVDCDFDTAIDACEIAANPALDCNDNGVLDSCDIATGTSNDVDANGVPDECKPDCNGNDLPDPYEIAQNPALDCDTDGVIDACEIAANPALDCDDDGALDVCEIAANPALDCDADGALDACEIAANPTLDCDLDGALDACELTADPTIDCDENGRIDSCDVAAGAEDENENDVPDTCEFALGDLDLDGTVGAADLSVLLSFWGFPNPPVGDLDGNGVIGGGDLSVLLSNWGPSPW
jgi:predicted outer membrane repeat protein